MSRPSDDHWPAWAQAWGTPLYVYDATVLSQHIAWFQTAAGSRPVSYHYAVKANGHVALLSHIAQAGFGFEVVSGGEMARVLSVVPDLSTTVFSGVGKTVSEMAWALAHGIQSIHIESLTEADTLAELARDQGRPAPVSIRLNVDILADTHPFIATGSKQHKFGLAPSEALSLAEHIQRHPQLFQWQGLACHIGSQITDTTAFTHAARAVMDVVLSCKAQGIDVPHVNMGGGLGIAYDEPTPQPDIVGYVQALQSVIPESHTLHLEPGRALVGPAGTLLTRIVRLKTTHEGKHFAILDAGMNDCIRPALYGAQHLLTPLGASRGPARLWEWVGPVCETADTWGSTPAPVALHPGQSVLIHHVGAYGMAMSSQYNSRPRPAEVWWDGQQASLIRPRETASQLFQTECQPHCHPSGHA